MKQIRRLFGPSPFLTLLVLNLGVLALWGLSFALAKIGFPYLTVPLGLAAFALPAVCLTITLEQVSESTLKPLYFWLWVAVISLIFTPAAVFGISQIVLHRQPIHGVISPFLIWWAFSLVLALGSLWIKRQSLTLKRFRFDQKTKKELLYVTGIFAAIMTINFIVYSLLPEGDGYAYLGKLRAIQDNPQLLTSETRGLFLVLLQTTGSVLRVDPYWILKLLLPLGHLTLILSCYIFATKFISNTRHRILFSLSPLFFPIVLQEILISRPQSVFLISFLPSLLIVSDILENKQNIRRAYYLVALMVIGLIGIKIHALFALITFFGLASIVLFLRHVMAKRPVDATIIIAGLLFLVYPQLAKTRVLSDLWHLIKLFAVYFTHHQFHWWFIDYYRNVDGIEVGWPGRMAIFYYGYNLGIVFPVVFLWLLCIKKLAVFKHIWKEQYWAIIFLFLFLFFIAEIAPRFELAYLPDRAWLFIALLLALILPMMVPQLKKRPGLILIKTLAVLGLVSVLGGTALTFAKQGWVTTAEVKAASFIRSKTPENAVFLSQGSARVMVRYYGNREFVHPADNVFLAGDTAAVEGFLNAEKQLYTQEQTEVGNRRKRLSYKLNELGGEIVRPDLNDAQLSNHLETLTQLHQEESIYFVDTALLRQLYVTVDRPIYMVYNTKKFNSLYGTRDWWRTSNFYGANLEQLRQSYPVIYDQDGIIIWEIRK